MAEIEIAILERNALSRRLESETALRRQVSAVETERTNSGEGLPGSSPRAMLAASWSGSIR